MFFTQSPGVYKSFFFPPFCLHVIKKSEAPSEEKNKRDECPGGRCVIALPILF